LKGFAIFDISSQLFHGLFAISVNDYDSSRCRLPVILILHAVQNLL